jgi:triphosphoribosyl-dephospho-CoA synthase
MTPALHGAVWRAPGPSGAAEIAALATAALLDELNTWPKPGLVSHIDNGSHTDMDAATLTASARALTAFFAELADAGAAGAGMEEFRAIGVAAEVSMLRATGGINTHRGAVFGLGLLCAAAGAARAEARTPDPATLCAMVQKRWGRAIMQGPVALHSHGTGAKLRYGAGGARAQAAAGFPQVQNIGLPALRRGRVLAPGNPEAVRVEIFFALLASVEDTNLLHRGGADGLNFAQAAAAEFLREGGVGRTGWQQAGADIHANFVARRLSPGGCADLLAMTLFLDALAARP